MRTRSHLILATAAAVALLSVPAHGVSDRGPREGFNLGFHRVEHTDSSRKRRHFVGQSRLPLPHVAELPGDDAPAIPEPTAALLFGAGALAAAWVAQRRGRLGTR